MQDWTLRDGNLGHKRGQKCRGGKCKTRKRSAKNSGLENTKKANSACG